MQQLAQRFAMVGGIAIGLLMLTTLTSVAGRTFFRAPIPGDIEIAQLLMAFAISCFLPWCQWQGSHVAIEFFTQRLGQRTQHTIGRVGHGLMGLVAGLLAWRTLIAAISALSTNEGSMILGIPIWLNYAVLVPGFAAMALIGLWRAVGQRP
jgi:TRAP-type C4-dicarboxylate transport system permease small subunit